MILTTRQLEEMRRVDIGTVDADALADLSGLAFNNRLDREERIARLMQGGGNLYCFCVGGVGVKIEFADGGPSLQDALTNFLIRAKSGL